MKVKPIEVYYMEKCEEVKELRRKLQEQARQKRQIIESILNDKSNNWHIVISKIINEIKKWG